jgi:hypothetical protein
VLSLQTHDLAADQSNGILYASTGALAVEHASAVVAIDPGSGAIGPAMLVGGEPNRLAISNDGQYLYVGVDAEGLVRRIDVAAGESDLTFPLRSAGSGSGALVAGDIVALPGSAQGAVVARSNPSSSPGDSGTVALDDSNPGALPDGPSPRLGTRLAVDSDGAILGYDGETTGAALHRARLGPDHALSLEQTRDNAIQAFYQSIVAQDDRLFSTSGEVIDTSTLETLMTLPGRGPVAPDLGNGRAYMLTGEGRHRSLVAFELTAAEPLWAVPIDGVLGRTDRLVRWSEAGLAFRTTAGQVFVITLTD